MLNTILMYMWHKALEYIPLGCTISLNISTVDHVFRATLRSAVSYVLRAQCDATVCLLLKSLEHWYT